MKKILFSLIAIHSLVHTTYGESAGGIFGNLKKKDVREGNIHLNDIPNILRGAIDLLMGIAGTIAIIFIIVGAYKILFGSLQQDKTKGRDTIIVACIGFGIASLAWFILKVIIDNLA